MTYKSFEELPAWKSAAILYNKVLDMFDNHGNLFSSGFRNQLDRAALSVSNNIAEGFDRVSTNELLSFLAIARGSAGEVRSMMSVIKQRPSVQPASTFIQIIYTTAHDCVKQITGWIKHIEDSEIKGKRHQTPEIRARKQAQSAEKNFRQVFLLSLDPKHPLYNSSEAIAARNESSIGNSQSSIGNSQSSIGNSQSSITNSQSSITNSQSSIDNSQSSITNSQSSIGNSQSSIDNSQSSIDNSQSSITNSQSSIGIGIVEGNRQ